MTKNISIPKLVKEAGKRLVFQISGDKLYLADKQGTFLIETDLDESDLEDLRKRGCEIQEKDSLKIFFDSNYNGNKRRYLAEDLGITLTDNSGRSVTWLIAEKDGATIVAKVSRDKLDIFREYTAEMSSGREAVAITSYSYRALVLPIRMAAGGMMDRASMKIIELSEAIRLSDPVRLSLTTR